MKRFELVVLLFVALLSGCATKVEVFIGTEVSSETDEMNFKIDQPPVMTLGIPLANYEKAEEFVVSFPRHLEGEYRLFRLSWRVIGVTNTGDFYPGVIIFEKNKVNKSGNFWAVGKVFAPCRKGVRIFILSTRAKYAYGSNGRIDIDRNLLDDKEYLSSIFPKGYPLDNLFESMCFGIKIASWKNKRTPFGFLKAPSEYFRNGLIEKYAVLNTGYTETERRVRDRRNVFSPNPILMAIGWSTDAYEEIQEQRGVIETTGWDFDSSISENEKKAIRKTLDYFRRKARVFDYGGMS